MPDALTRLRFRSAAFLFACFITTTAAHAAQAAATGRLDGSTIVAAFVDQAGKHQGEDNLVFSAGRLDAEGLRATYAFEAAAYTAEKAKDGAITFTAAFTSAKHGSLLIEGRIAKQEASGRRIWSKPGKTPIEHAFSGTLKPTGAK